MQIFRTITDPGLLMRLTEGAIGVMPTDTVWGVVCRAQDEQAAARLYAAKHREHKPGTLIAASVEQLVALGIPEHYAREGEAWWPAPVSVILPAGPELFYLHQGLESLACRVPADPDLRALLTQTGPLLTSSANQPGEPPATSQAEAQKYFGDSVDFYIDAPPAPPTAPSTVVRVTPESGIEVLRQGAVTIN